MTISKLETVVTVKEYKNFQVTRLKVKLKYDFVLTDMLPPISTLDTSILPVDGKRHGKYS